MSTKRLITPANSISKGGVGTLKVAIILSVMSALEIMEDVQERHLPFKLHTTLLHSQC